MSQTLTHELSDELSYRRRNAPGTVLPIMLGEAYG